MRAGTTNLPMQAGADWRGIADTMTTRIAVVGAIVLIVVLMTSIAAVAMLAGDIPERTGGIITTVLGTMATVLAGLLLFLRLDTVDSKVDDAASRAAIAAQKASIVENKVEAVHHDILNGGLRDNVRRAISEDRHAQRTSDTVTIDRNALDELRRRAENREA